MESAKALTPTVWLRKRRPCPFPSYWRVDATRTMRWQDSSLGPDLNDTFSSPVGNSSSGHERQSPPQRFRCGGHEVNHVRQRALEFSFDDFPGGTATQ